MKNLLEALKGARKISEREYPEGKVVHYLLPTGKVIEVIAR